MTQIGRVVSAWISCGRVVEWIKNDTTNWKKINDDNGGTYEYFARINQ